MTSERDRRDTSDLEAALTDLGRQIVYPPIPDVSTAVLAHLKTRPRPRVPGFRLRPVMLAPVIACLVIIASVLALSPGSRAAVASWFQIVGVRIEFGGSPPGPIGKDLNLGRRVSLSEAQSHSGFPILVPRDPGPPDEVYDGTPPLAGSVSLLYRARPGLPRSPATGAGLLVTEYRGYFLDVKLLRTPSALTPLKILGDAAVWIQGMPHVVYDLDKHGRLLRDTIRLAGNVLVWYHGGITIRMEGQLSLARAVAIARSMQVAGEQ